MSNHEKLIQALTLTQAWKMGIAVDPLELAKVLETLVSIELARLSWRQAEVEIMTGKEIGK